MKLPTLPSRTYLARLGAHAASHLDEIERDIQEAYAWTTSQADERRAVAKLKKLRALRQAHFGLKV
jgi:hypothetical protein